MTTNLIKYEAACRALAECKAVDEVKAWVDKAAAMQAYGQMAKDKTLEVDAAEIRIRAERRLGEMLAGTKAEGGLSKGAAGSGVNQHTPKSVRSSVTTAPKLADAKISKDLSSRAQKLAAVPEAEFEAELAAKRERDRQDGARVSARLQKSGAKHLKKRPPDIPPEDYSAKDYQIDNMSGAIDALKEENNELKQRLAVESMDATEDDKLAANDLITELRKQVKSLTAELEATRASRNQLMTTNAELVKTVAYWKRQAAKAEKAAA